VNPARVPNPGADGPDVIDALLHGDPSGSQWRPGETDTSIRPGWFYHPAEDDKGRSVADLVRLYFSSVGRNSKLLLNVPPTREGLLHGADTSRLAGFRQELERLFARDFAVGRPIAWHSLSPRSAVAQVELSQPMEVGIIDLREEIEQGQRVARYIVEGSDGGEWRRMSEGTTIGCRKLDRCEPVTVRRVRVRVVEAIDRPLALRISLYAG
jgi:alpha-L-fucosidase